jgi:hypothetical protein
MTGHFKRGVWFEDPKPPVEPMMIKVKVDLDTSDAEASIERFTKKLADLKVIYEQFSSLLPEE